MAKGLLFVGLLLSLLFLGASGAKHESHHIGRSRDIFMHNRVIDTTSEIPHGDFDNDGAGLFYVTFKSRFAGDRANIEKLEEQHGLRFDGYLPQSSYMLYAPHRKVGRLAENKNVLWVGAMPATDKVPHKMARVEHLTVVWADGHVPGQDEEIVPHLSTEFERLKERMAARFPEQGLFSWGQFNPANGNRFVTLSIHSLEHYNTVLSWVLHHGSPRIRFVEPQPENRLHSALETHIIVDGNYSCATNNPLCDYSTFFGPINGTGQTIGIIDSGVDMASCFFYDPNFQADTLDLTAHKVSFYQTNSANNYGDATDGTGHGTFVAGLAVGAVNDQTALFTSAEVTEANTFNGVAPGAKLYVSDAMVGRQSSLSVDFSTLASNYFDPMFNNGVRIAVIPWGSQINLAGNKAYYSSQDNVFDTYLATHPEFLVVASAGNNGLGGNGRIDSPASAKNTLAVGGSLGAHNSFLFTDYVPNLADVAQAEYVAYCTIGDVSLYYSEVFCTVMGQDTPCTSFQSVLCAGQFDGTPSGCCGLPYFAPICCPSVVINFWAASRALYSQDSGYPQSSRGPTYDGRIKPEVVAPAQRLFSANYSGLGADAAPYCGVWSDTPYTGQAVTVSEGTSGAAGVVAGAAALVRQWMINGYYPVGVPNIPESIPITSPSAALVKAALINSGESLFQIDHNGASAWQAIPNLAYEIQGFGRVNLKNTLSVDPSVKNLVLLDNQVILYTNHTLRYCIRVNDGSTYIRITAVWTDPPASIGAGVANVNNVDLVLVRDDGHEFRANKKTQFDSVNNVEDIYAPALTGRFYTIAIHGTYIPQGPQPVAIAISGDLVCNSDTGICLQSDSACIGPTSSCPMDCSLRGQCLNGLCICQNPYTGIDCSLTPCPNDCSGNGVCDGETGLCTCNDFWNGLDCSNPNPSGETPSNCPACQCRDGVGIGAVVGISIGCFFLGCLI